MSETWVWNDTVDVDYYGAFGHTFNQINFVCNNVEYNKIVLGGNSLPSVRQGLFYDSTRVYTIDPDTWVSNEYKTITFTTSPTGDLLTYLQVNAVKQSAGGVSA